MQRASSGLRGPESRPPSRPSVPAGSRVWRLWEASENQPRRQLGTAGPRESHLSRPSDRCRVQNQHELCIVKGKGFLSPPLASLL